MAQIGVITQEQREFVETWESVTPVTNYVIRLDPRGDERFEQVAGARKFMITTAERILTQDRVVDPVNDPFTNGHFRPLVVPDDVNVETNPNALSDEDIIRIFRASDTAWREYMNVIDAPATVQRMVDLALEDDSITVKRFNELKAKLNANKRDTRQKDADQFEGIAGPEVTTDGKPKSTRRRSTRAKAPAGSSSAANA